MGEDRSSGRDRFRYFVERMCRSLGVRAVLTDDDFHVIWAVGRDLDHADGGSALLVDLLPSDDRDTVSFLRGLLGECDHASATAPSGMTYHVLDGHGDLEENGLLWYWHLASADRSPIADERAELLEQAVNRFLLDLRMLGVGTTGPAGRRLPGADTLSPRERAVVDALVRGGRTVTIARELFVSQSTVRSHLSSAFRKLGVSSQAELMERLGTATLDLRDQDADALADVDGTDRSLQPDAVAQDEPV